MKSLILFYLLVCYYDSFCYIWSREILSYRGSICNLRKLSLIWYLDKVKLFSISVALYNWPNANLLMINLTPFTTSEVKLSD